MNTIRPFFYLLMTAFLTIQAKGALALDQYDKLLELSATSQQVRDLPKVFKSAVYQSYQQNPVMPYAKLEKLLEATETSFVSSNMLEQVKRNLVQQLPPADLPALLTWYESPVARKISAGEANASTPEAYEFISINGASLLQDQQRVAAAERIEEILKMTDFSMKLQKQTGVAAIAAILSAQQPQQPIKMNEISSMIQAQLEQLRPQLKQQIIMSAVYSYKDISLKSLSQYESFLKTPHAQRFHQATMAGLAQAIESAVTDWVEVFPSLVQETQAKKQP